MPYHKTQQWNYNLQNKDKIRKGMLAKRRAITAGEYSAAGLSAKQLLAAHPLFQASQHIACYFGQEDEFDCAPIIEEICLLGKFCYLPVLSSLQKKSLAFVNYHPGDPLRLNRYHIFEPESGDRLAPDRLDLVIVPLVAFDTKGHRVGMGGGYYDRTFAFKRGVNKPYLLGLGYELQKVAEVPADSWDVLLDGVLTEKIIYQISASRPL